MKATLALRASLALWLALLALTAVKGSWFGELPDGLREYLATRPRPELSVAELPLILIGGVFLVGGPICAVGLMFMKRWARFGLSVIYLLNILGVAFLGPTVRPALDSAIGELGVVAVGFGLGVAWFSDALPRTTP